MGVLERFDVGEWKGSGDDSFAFGLHCVFEDAALMDEGGGGFLRGDVAGGKGTSFLDHFLSHLACDIIAEDNAAGTFGAIANVDAGVA